MKPYQANIYIYAESENEVQSLVEAFHGFLIYKREQGIVVTAKALTEALNKYKDNFFLNQYLKQHGRGN